MSEMNIPGPLVLSWDRIPKQPLWTIFNNIWKPIIGSPADKFEFVPGKTPMSTLTETAAVLVSYYIVILGGRELMRNQPPIKLNGLFKLHNLILTIISGTLLLLFIEQLVPTLWRSGLYDSICGASGWTRPLVTLYHLNYITKYIELIDTLFLVVRKKPLTFLHTYHHGATALLCYTQLVGHTPVSWVPITLNLAVHVVMYWYYFQSARGIRVSWKQWITRLQIIQFVIDLGFVYFATYSYTASTYVPNLPHVGTCKGEEYAAFAGCAILSSYLGLFLSFYATTYKKHATKRRSSGGPTKDAADSLASKEVPNAAEAKEDIKFAAERTERNVEKVAEKGASKLARSLPDPVVVKN